MHRDVEIRQYANATYILQLLKLISNYQNFVDTLNVDCIHLVASTTHVSLGRLKNILKK